MAQCMLYASMYVYKNISALIKVLKCEYSGFIFRKKESKYKDISEQSSWIMTNKCENPEHFFLILNASIFTEVKPNKLFSYKLF